MTAPPQRRPSRQDLLIGAVFLVLGVGFAVGATDYGLGTPAAMGAGAFPFVMGILLTLFGGITVVKGVVAGEAEPIGPVPWRAIALIVGAVLFFGLTVRGLGVAPAVFVAVLLSAFASERTRPLGAFLIAAGLTVVSVLVFVIALQLRLPLIGPWLGGV
jgi:hypothetical protein